MLLDRDSAAAAFYQTRLYMPVVLSLALVGFIWQLLYSQDYGFSTRLPGSTDRLVRRPEVQHLGRAGRRGWQHVGYIMLLYLAGLKGVDPSLREAAKVDGATEVQTFFRIVFPVMRPINIIVLVITVIEALRAFDIVWVINKGRNGLELIVGAGHPEHRRRGQPDRLRLGAGDDHAGDLARSSSSSTCAIVMREQR